MPTIVPGVLFPPNAEVRAARGTTVIREVQYLPGDREPGTADRAELLDVIGCEVIDLRLGATDVRALAPGAYFVREAQAQAQAVRRVAVMR